MLTFSNHRERARFWSNSAANVASLGSLKGNIALNAQALTEDAALHIRVIQKGRDQVSEGPSSPLARLTVASRTLMRARSLSMRWLSTSGISRSKWRNPPHRPSTSKPSLSPPRISRHRRPLPCHPYCALRGVLSECGVSTDREKLIRSVVGGPEERIRRAMTAATQNRDILSAALEQSRTGPCPRAPKALPGYKEFDDADLNPPLPRGNFVSLNQNGAHTVFWVNGIDGYCGYRDNLHLHIASPVPVTPDAPVILDTSWWRVAKPNGNKAPTAMGTALTVGLQLTIISRHTDDSGLVRPGIPLLSGT